MLQSRAVPTHRGQWPQVHHLPHDNMSSSSCSLSSCLLDPLLFPSAFHLFIFPSCFCIQPISLDFSPLLLFSSFLLFHSLISPLVSSSLMSFSLPLLFYVIYFPFLFLLYYSLIISSYYLSSPLSSSSFFLFLSHLFFLLLSTQLLYSSPHFFSFLFLLLVNYPLIYPPLSSSFLPLCFFILLSTVFI